MSDDASTRPSYQHSGPRRVITWGGVSVDSDGHSENLPEAEALVSAIGAWISYPDLVAQATAAYVDLLRRPEPAVRHAILVAVQQLATRDGQVPNLPALRQAIATATNDSDPDVRAAARDALQAVDAH